MYKRQQQLRLYKIKEGMTLSQGLCLQKHSEFKGLFDYQLNKMEETGLKEFLRQKYLPQLYGLQEAAGSPAAAAAAISWSGVFFPFALLAGSVGVSLICLGLEMGRNCLRHKQGLARVIPRKKSTEID